jgi:hypothetical protein
MSDPLQITLRLIHVFSGVFWAGSVFFILRFLFPALAESGTGGQAVMQQMMTKQKLGILLPIAATLTVLSGLGMYARNVIGSSGVWAHSRQGMTYGIGGLSAILALILGAAVIGPSLEKVVKIQLAAHGASRALTPDEQATAARLSGRVALGTRITGGLLAVTVAAMAVGRYVY